MEHLKKYEEFNLDLSRALKAGIRRRGYNVASLGEVLGFSEMQIAQITEKPISVPACDFGVVVEHLDLISEFYEAYLRELERSIRRDSPPPRLR
jgi:hypothetical protein